MTVEERLAVLEQAWAALQAQTPTQYYTSRHGGEEIDKGIDRAKEGGAIDAALAGKASKYTALLGTPPATWTEVWTLGPGTYSWVQYDPLAWEPEDTVSGAIRTELTIHSAFDGSSTLTATLRYVDGAMTLRSYNGEAVTSVHDGRWAYQTTAADLAGKANTLGNCDLADLDTFIVEGDWFGMAIEHTPYGQTHGFVKVLCFNGAGFAPDQSYGATQVIKQKFSLWNENAWWERCGLIKASTGTILEWSDWVKIATATPPQEIDLPLAAGWTIPSNGYGRYRKNQFDEVSISFVLSSTVAVTGGVQIAALPAGYRPSSTVSFPVILSTEDWQTVYAHIDVGAYGDVLLWDAPEGKKVNSIYCGTISFLAA